MKVLLYLLFLTLVSCGGDEGSQKQDIIGNDNKLSSNPGTGIVSDTLAKFKNAVNRNQWGQHKFFKDFNKYSFNYIDPQAGQNCKGSFIKLCFNSSLGRTQAIHTTSQLGSIVTAPLVSTNRIKDVVNKANAKNAYYSNGYWVIEVNSETFVFNTLYPLGGNPIYYKDSSGKIFSLNNYSYE